MDVRGAVLAGGASRRMGRPKAIEEVEGRPMARRAADALRDAGAQRVALVGGDPRWADDLGLDALADRWPGEGPLAGLATAVAALDGAPAAIVLVVGCDQPWLDPRDLRRLVEALAAEPPSVLGAVAAPGPGRVKVLPSAWRTGAGPMLVDLVVAGRRRLADAPVAAAHVAVPVASSPLADVDRPEDLTDRTRAGRTPGRAPSAP